MVTNIVKSLCFIQLQRKIVYCNIYQFSLEKLYWLYILPIDNILQCKLKKRKENIKTFPHEWMKNIRTIKAAECNIAIEGIIMLFNEWDLSQMYWIRPSTTNRDKKNVGGFTSNKSMNDTQDSDHISNKFGSSFGYSYCYLAFFVEWFSKRN